MTASPVRTGGLPSLVRDYPTWIFLAALVIGSAPYVVPIWSVNDLASRGPYYLDVLLICASIIACFAGRSRVSCPKARRFWDLLGLAFVCWLITRLIDTSAARLWFDITADVFVLGFFVFAFLAFATGPDRVRESLSLTGRIQVAAAVTMLAGLVVYFTVIPITSNRAEYVSWVPHLIVVLVLDLCLIITSARALLNADSPAWTPVYRLLTVSWVLWLCTDFLYTAWQVGPWVVAPGTPIDLIWAIPFVPLVLAA